MGPRRNNHLSKGVTSYTQELLATTIIYSSHSLTAENTSPDAEAFGQLVQLGFDVAVFTPAAYQRRSLRRPSVEPSSCGRLRT